MYTRSNVITHNSLKFYILFVSSIRSVVGWCILLCICMVWHCTFVFTAFSVLLLSLRSLYFFPLTFVFALRIPAKSVSHAANTIYIICTEKKQQLEVPRARHQKPNSYTHSQLSALCVAAGCAVACRLPYTTTTKCIPFVTKFRFVCNLCVDFNTISVMGCLLRYG